MENHRTDSIPNDSYPVKSDRLLGAAHRGSDARIIMGADEAALLRLWQEKRGEIEPEDLSGNLIVQLGTVTEQLNRHWYERNTGQVVTEVQRQVFHPVKRWLAATLDDIVEGSGAVFEAKFMLPWSFSEEAAAGARFFSESSSNTQCVRYDASIAGFPLRLKRSVWRRGVRPTYAVWRTILSRSPKTGIAAWLPRYAVDWPGQLPPGNRSAPQRQSQGQATRFQRGC